MKLLSILGVDSFACNKDTFCYFRHLGVVKVGLIRLAKLEVIKHYLVSKKVLDVR